MSYIIDYWGDYELPNKIGLGNYSYSMTLLKGKQERFEKKMSEGVRVQHFSLGKCRNISMTQRLPERKKAADFIVSRVMLKFIVIVLRREIGISLALKRRNIVGDKEYEEVDSTPPKILCN